MIDSLYVVNQKVFYMYEKYVFFILTMCQNIRIFADYLKRKYDEEIFMFDILYRHGGVPCTK